MRLPLFCALLAGSAAPLAAQLSPTLAAPEAQAAVTAPRFAEVRLRTGVRLRYAEQGDPAGQPVLLLHGITDSWYSFSRVLPLLPAAWRVLAVDQRGHGESDRPASGYTVADFAEDAIAFLDVLGIQRATIVGHSMGAFVAQRVAIIAPDRVERLVLIDGAPSARSPALLGLRDELADLPPRMPEEYLHGFQYSTVYGAVPSAFMDGVIAESAKVPTRVARSALDGLLASGDSAQLGSIRAPTLLVWGDRDGIFDDATQRQYARAIPASRRSVYRNVGHAPHWEAPDRFAGELREFLSSAARR